MAKQQVATSPQKAPEVVESDLDLEFLKQDSGMGLEDLGSSDISLPFLNLLQPLSEQCNTAASTYVEGAVAGMVINTVSGELFNARKEPIKFIPCYYDRKYVEWIDRESGGGYVGEHTIDSDILDFCERDDRGIPRLKNDKTHMVVETAYWYGLFFSVENNSWSQCLIVFKSSGLKVSRKWNNSIVTSKIPNTDIQAPRWLYEYDLYVESQKKGNNTWWAFQPERSQIVNKKLYNMAKDYYTLLKAGVLKRDVKSEQMSGIKADEDAPF